MQCSIKEGKCLKVQTGKVLSFESCGISLYVIVLYGTKIFDCASVPFVPESIPIL